MEESKTIPNTVPLVVGPNAFSNFVQGGAKERFVLELIAGNAVMNCWTWSVSFAITVEGGPRK